MPLFWGDWTVRWALCSLWQRDQEDAGILSTLRRWLGTGKRWFNRRVEFKIGIMMQQPVVRDSSRSDDRCHFVRTQTHRAGLPFSLKEFEKRSQQGNFLYELFVDGNPVSYGWVAGPGAQVGILHELNMRVPEHALYIWDCATPEEHRGKGYFQTLLRSMMQSQGVETNVALVAVDSNNTASKAALKKVGFQPLFTYWSFRVFGRVVLSLALKDGRLTWAQPQFDQLQFS
ncbi:GNAT family N-acetyltransferase [Marinobacter sp. chi1]|uniref:GNAT family N-acetyltransferase n=1 Tax=Marinobacter suaedae TaxID=3057675 RepID=A0ABT8W2C1_9GAMM|nr:GNAT family N-acetyltransferase [Marinobacter sp. chi1]MDO3722398.1 GNAT family N-acetyltransferase [Marinobacter sp. chi1]